MTYQWEKRESIIPLPKKEDGFSVVMLLGTTGAGKTTLLRQFMGTDPEVERFPSTSTSKTTTADYEIICDCDIKEYSAVVSFLTAEVTEEYIKESIIQALFASIKKSKTRDIFRSNRILLIFIILLARNSLI